MKGDEFEIAITRAEWLELVERIGERVGSKITEEYALEWITKNEVGMAPDGAIYLLPLSEAMWK